MKRRSTLRLTAFALVSCLVLVTVAPQSQAQSLSDRSLGLYGGAGASGSAGTAPADTPPGVCVPITPTGTITDTRFPTFVWQEAARASWYLLTITKEESAYYKKWFTATTWTSTWAFAVGSYAWKMQAWNDYGLGPESPSATFAVPPTPPGAVVTLSPTGVLEVIRRPQFSWVAGERAEWYQLQINRDGQSYYSTWLQNIADWLPTWDLAPGNYQWWVRTWNSSGYGPWSPAAAFLIRRMVPGAPALLAPTGIVDAASVTFDWTDVEYGRWYQLYVERSGQEKYLNEWIETESRYDTHLVYGRYRSWVRGWGPDGLGPWSPVADFSFGVPEPFAPTGRVAGVTYDPHFSWSIVPAATWYQVRLERNGSPYREPWVSNSPSWWPSGPVALLPGEYEWYVRAWGPGVGTGPWSAMVEFSLGAPVLVYPQGDLPNSPSEVTWDDSDSAYATWYDILVVNWDKDLWQDFWVAKLNTRWTPPNRSAAIPADIWPLQSGLHFWMVEPWYSAGYGGFSDVGEFSVP